MLAILESETVRVAPVLLNIPPAPPPFALLEDVFKVIVELEMERVPLLSNPPPLLEVLAPVTVTPEIVKLPP